MSAEVRPSVAADWFDARDDWFTETECDPYERDHVQQELDGGIRGLVYGVLAVIACAAVGAMIALMVFLADLRGGAA